MSAPLPPSEPACLPSQANAAAAQKSQRSLLQRLGGWRNTQLLKRALRQAGDPNLVLDLPCGNGQLWPLLARHANRVILAADNSAEMLAQAQMLQPRAVVERVRLLQTSVFAIDLPANAVECILCLHLFHRLATGKQRLAMLGELHRVTSDSVILSARINRQLPSQPAGAAPTSTGRQAHPRLSPVALAAEFKLAGFTVAGYHDLVPGCGSRRLYLLRKEYKK